MSNSGFSFSNRSSGSPSIPIPPRRSIEDLLNLTSRSPASPSGTSASPRRERSQQRSAASPTSRPFYNGLEGSRPVSARHASTSISPATARHSIGGGSGPAWGPRSVSSTVFPTGHNSSSAGLPRSVSGFEPRVIRGNPEHTGSTEHPPAASRRDSTSTSPSRNRRQSTGVVNISGVTRSPAAPSLRATPPSSSNHAPAAAPPAAGSALAANAAAATFEKPSYLQYSALCDLIHTDTSPALPPSRYSIDHPTAGPSGLIRREATPFTDSDDDSESSMGIVGHGFSHSRERGRGRERTSAYTAAAQLAASNPVLRLPTRWSDQDRNSSLTISHDGRELLFYGPTSQGEKDASAARSNHSIPPACGIYYYEVEILSKGQKGHISIGFSGGEVRLTRLPGWEKNSWGYHGDDGNSFASEKNGTPFGPRFSTGDVIGCGIDFSQYKAFYTKNGVWLGSVFENVGRDGPIYPSVGLRTAGEAVRVNFGHEQPFKFDIDYHVHRTRERTWAGIQAATLKWSIDDESDVFTIEVDKPPSDVQDSVPSGSAEDGTVKVEPENSTGNGGKKEVEEFVPIKLPQDFQAPLNKLVLSYLVHHGYERTARAFQIQSDARVKKAQDDSRIAIDGKRTLQHDTDMKMETDGVPDDLASDTPAPAHSNHLDLDGLDADSTVQDSHSRQRIVNAVLTGNVDVALEETQQWHPVVLEWENGLLLFKLRCRKFVELILEASEALKRVKAETEAAEVEVEVVGDVDANGADGVAMEVDGDDSQPEPAATNGFTNGSAAIPIRNARSRKRTTSRASLTPTTAQYQAALGSTLAYGRRLQADYKSDARPEVQSLFKRTFSLVAYDDPFEAGGDVAELVSQDARSELAQEMNQAILESQGRPSRPALERLYRQTGASLVQLALMGEGAAAFADMKKEFLE